MSARAPARRIVGSVEHDTGATAATGEPAIEPIPKGSILVHIGPPKTATTQVQASLYAARPALRRHGVRHAGPNRHPAGSVHAVLGRASAFAGGVVPSIQRWTNLVDQIHRASEPRVVVSSEFFADAPPDVVRRIADDLGPDRVHVVITLRPLAKILPSQWMQFICDGMTTTWDEWLHAMFDRPGSRTPGFWRRHRHHELVARWAEAVSELTGSPCSRFARAIGAASCATSRACLGLERGCSSRSRRSWATGA